VEKQEQIEAKALSKNLFMTKLNWVLNWSRKSSLFMFQFGLA